MRNRKSLILSKNGEEGVIPIFVEQQIDIENQIIVPIILNGDCYGTIVVFDNDKYSKMSACELKSAELGAIYLSKQFDV